MHNLFTFLNCMSLNNLWVICGSVCITQNQVGKRVFGVPDISKRHRGKPLFYRNPSVTRFYCEQSLTKSKYRAAEKYIFEGA